MNAKTPDTIRWSGGIDGHLVLIDQTALPADCRTVECRLVSEVWEAIKVLRVRGAPAIGIAAAYGVLVGLGEEPLVDHARLFARIEKVVDYLGSSRPTAVNLFWALERMRQRADRERDRTVAEIRDALLDEAERIHSEDREMCRLIGRFGSELVSDPCGILTHCNAGGLATSEYGTALAVVYAAHEQGKRIHVFADETRPLLQGARLTTWELLQHGVPTTLLCDSMAAQVMREGRIDVVITGADRIAANGDTANKIGTYGLAVLARAHEIPFYIAAPTSTFDLQLSSGDNIPIEQRDRREVTHPFDRAIAPETVGVYNPAFDVTPAELITAIVTERGVVQPVQTETIARLVAE